MTRFTVPDMSCGHCTAAIEKAIREVDTGATIRCDLTDRSVSIDSSLPSDALRSAIADAGYEATAA